MQRRVKCPSPESDRAAKQTDRRNQRLRETHTRARSETERQKEFSLTGQVCLDVLHSARLPGSLPPQLRHCHPTTAERRKRDEPSGGRQADHEKQREKQRVAVSQERGRSGGGGSWGG